jgi:uncharacterized membrane protein YkvA (DUF1232 family)
MEIPATYDALRTALDGTLERLAGRLGGRLGAYAFVGADLFVFAGRVLSDARVPPGVRGEILAAALYVASPVDLVPETLFGPAGLVDDAVVLSRLFDVLLNGVEIAVARDLWPGDPAVLDRIQTAAKDGRRVFARGLEDGVRRLFERGALLLRREVGRAIGRLPGPRLTGARA